ncbi:hypothetical protein EBR57_00660 [bacterium]|nr:hypothetical protein [bacterium]
MNVSGDSALNNRMQNRPSSTPTPMDPSQFTQALKMAASHVQTVVPAANEAGKMALAKKKEKDSIYRVNEASEMGDDEESESVHQIVQQIARRVKNLVEIERQTLGL